jgi:uncharacterized protein YndB with AHSA1/START domain
MDNKIISTNIVGRASISIHAHTDKVWEALTRPELIKQYFFGTDTKTDWKEGSPITFEGEWQGQHYQDKGTVLNVQPQKLLRYTYWSSMSGIEDKPENYVTITYELSEEQGHTTVSITQENIPDEKMKDHSEQNWRKVLHELKNFVENRKE